MIEIIKELKIEVSKPNIFQAIVAKQYDMNTRFIKATLVDGENIIYIPKDADNSVKVVINAERPDGQSKGFDGEVNEDGTVTVPLHSWMLELNGTVVCDISVIDTESDDNKKLTTTSFTLLVEKAAYGGDDVTNDPQYDILVSLLETCAEAGATAQEALDKSNEALEKSASADAKYTACVEATENANAVREEIEAGGYIESLKEMNNGSKFSVWVGTLEEYNAIETKAPNCLYIQTDDSTLPDMNANIEANKIETIFSNNTFVEKKADGTLKITAKYAFENTIDVAYGNAYYSRIITETFVRIFLPADLGFNVKEIFSVTATIGQTNELLGVNVTTYNTSDINFYVFSHKVLSEVVTAEVVFELIGKWEDKGE